MGTPWPGAASAAGLHEPIHWVDLQQATERRQGKKVAPSTICFDPSKPLVPNEVLALRHGSHRRTQTWHFACSSGALVLRYFAVETLAALSSPSIRGGGPNGASTWRKNAPARRSIGSRSRYGRSGSRSHSVRIRPYRSATDQPFDMGYDTTSIGTSLCATFSWRRMLEASRKGSSVTGGAGFLGSHLCERLPGRGADIVCVCSRTVT